MLRNNVVPNRQSHRYKGYDYASAGAYFVTICVQHFRSLLGEVVNQEMISNAAGKMLQSEWIKLPERFPTVQPDEFAIMPNHLHFIVWLQFDPNRVESPTSTLAEHTSAPNEESSVGASLVSAPNDQNPDPQFWLHPTLGNFVGVFKSLTTNAYIDGVKNQGWPRFAKHLWQRDYYDHIIRNEIELEQIRHYIRTNPARWMKDQLHTNAPPNQFNRNRLND